MKVCDVSVQHHDDVQPVRVYVYVYADDNASDSADAAIVDLCEECRAAIVEHGLVRGIVEQYAAANPPARRRRRSVATSSEPTPQPATLKSNPSNHG